jgi:hypothetical protein
MKKFFVFGISVVLTVLLLGGICYGQNPAFVPGSFLWQEEGYLMGVPGETACSVLDQNFKTAAEVQSNTGETLSDSDYVGTGATVKAEGQLEAVILGDVTGDGRVTTTDYLRIKRVFSGDMALEGAYGVAADVDSDGKINSTDYLKIKKCFEGSVDLYTGLKIDPYVSEFEHKDYDMSGYKMDRSKFNIGAYYMTSDILSEQFIKDYKNDFAGDFITCGITGTGTKAKNFMKWCDQYGVGVIGRHNGLTKWTYTSAPGKLDPADWTDFESQLEAYSMEYNCLWSDEVFDEPRTEYFNWLAGAKSRYDARFSDRFIYYNLNPVGVKGLSDGCGAQDYRDYIRQYVNTVDTDYISFDIYPFDNQFQGMHLYYLENMDVVASACRETGRDFWLISQAGSKLATNPLTKAQISWQMYTAMAYGSKAVMHACLSSADGWWEEGASLVNKDGTYNDIWTYAGEVNKEVKSFSDVYMQYDNLGVFGMATPQNSFVATQIRSQTRRNDARGYSGARGFSDITASRGLLVGSFAEKTGNGYAMMLVDSSDPYKGDNGNNTVTFRTAVSEGVKVTAYIGGTSTVLTPADGVYTVALTNGQGCFVTVSNP